MIESICITNVATFQGEPELLHELSQFNYIFGSNGTGKTTISRIIADQELFPDCSISWEDGRPLETVVLNLDFVEKNFNQLRGVFTLGEKQKDALEKIKQGKQELDKEYDDLTQLKNTLSGSDGNGGKEGELFQLEADFREKCWAQKQKHDEKLKGGFAGYRNNAENFKEKVLHESESNKASLLPVEDLEKRAELIYGEVPTREEQHPMPDMEPLILHESNPILSKQVIGKDDVDIASMVKKLGNSDWVRQGLVFYEENDHVCPFCQQDTSDTFALSLAEYFDETFETDSETIDNLIIEYTKIAGELQDSITNIINRPGKFLNVEELKVQKSLLDQVIDSNQLLLERKKQEPSQVIELKSHNEVSIEIEKIISNANAKVAEHNHIVENFETEEQNLTSQIWRLVLKELDSEIKLYRSRKDGLNKAIASITKKIKETNSQILKKEQEIQNLEKQATSIQPTIDGINNILLRFGFDSFKLAMGNDKKSYKLIRPNGEDARDTLSEGEKSFVVFLYFYHLLRGSISESGITSDRVVVFDDPVSSLDCEILFVVSSLIREICEGIREERGYIKQIFVFTHNIYFHREVTFNERRKSGKLNEETFWIISRPGAQSNIYLYDENPIKTSYELLWMDVRKPNINNPRIENTLRRILEHYFRIMGSINLDEIYSKFDGPEKLICRSLFSWVNAGSHHAYDDIYMAPSETMVKNFLNVFRAIFERTGHGGHYKMMMGDDFVEQMAENTKPPSQ